MKSEQNEGNSDLQQLVQAFKQSMMMSSEVSKARRNVRAPPVNLVGQSFKTWLSQFMKYADLCASSRRIVERFYSQCWTSRPLKRWNCSSFQSSCHLTTQLIKRFDSGKTRRIINCRYVRGVRGRTKISRDSPIAC